jgi:hypothetical protein
MDDSNFIKKEDLVSCETCRCLIKKDDAVKVKERIPFYGTLEKYYCKVHAPKYERFDGFHYYREMKVDYEGEPIGYTKMAETETTGAKIKK